jgi:predicted esterase
MNRQTNHLFLPILMVFLFITSPSANGQFLFNGRITDTVKCQDKPGQTYSLFVPSSYSTKSRWPLLLLFDPGGQGAVAVKAFRQAAEKYGYILACSHNSRNGPMNNNFAAAGFMMNDLERQFSIDNNRIYAAGFSGGSRFALALASSNNFIAGVIGCGAGLPNDRNLVPSKKSSFIYYGIAGTRDMNMPELFELMTFFNSNTMVLPYLRTFDGGHQWPPSDILTQAVEWIKLQAMKKNLEVTDSEYIKYLSEKTKTQINLLLKEGNRLDAVRYLEYAIRDFPGIPGTNEMRTLLTTVEQSKEYREDSREWSRVVSQERNMEEKYISSVQTILYSGTAPDTTAIWWKKEISSLINMKAKENRYSQMASRLLNFISILCSEQGISQYGMKQYKLSGFFFDLCTMSDSENPANYYNLARSLSLSNEKGKALEALNKAIGHGFTSKKAIISEQAFNDLRNDDKYKLMIAGMK